LAPNYAVILQFNESQAYEVQHVAEGEWFMIFMKNLACQMPDQKQRKQVELVYRVRNMPMISRISVEGNGVIHMNMLPGSYCSLFKLLQNQHNHTLPIKSKPINHCVHMFSGTQTSVGFS
jgi:hypothetical protein